MANTVFKLRRSSVAGKVPNTSTISIGELGLNLTDKILYSSDGSSVFEIGANNSSYTTNGNITLATNNKKLAFSPLAGGNNVYFTQQSDDNFVFYSTDTSNNPRAIWSVFANSASSNLNIAVRTQFNGGLYIPSGVSLLDSTGSQGSAGQILASNGSSNVYWVSPGAASVNTSAQFTWSNIHTFQANVSFTGSGLAVNSNTGSVYFGGISDANWRISRNAGVTTKFFYTNNSLDIIAASSSKEGIVFGWTGNSYLETGYAGTFTTLPIYVGNSSVNTTINATSFTGTSNNASYLGGTAAASYVQNTDSRTLSGNLTFSANVFVTGAVVNAVLYTTGAPLTGTGGFYTNTTTLIVGNNTINTTITSAGLTVNGASVVNSSVVNSASHTIGSTFIANTTGVYHTGTVNAASHTVGTSTIANTTGVYTGIVNAATISTGSVNVINASGLTTTANINIGAAGELIVTAGAGIYANGGLGTAGQVLTSNASSIYWSTVSSGATLNANNTETGTFYFGMANTTSGTWTNAVVSTTKISFIPNTGALTVNGSISATTKSFLITHPTKPGMQLRYASLEGPENGVYVRGRIDGTNVIHLPDYWSGLVDLDTITVNLTPIGSAQNLYVTAIDGLKIHIDTENHTQPYCYYHVYAERKDVDKLIVEY